MVFGLLWTHISPLQMNINKELLISAACTVREYVCMQGREQALLLCCSSSTQPGLPSHLSSSSFRLLSYSFFGFLPAHSFSLPFLFVTNCYATRKDVANGGSRVVPLNVFFNLFVIYDTHFLIEQGGKYIYGFSHESFFPKMRLIFLLGLDLSWCIYVFGCML